MTERGSGTICRNDPQGALRKWFLTPFLPRPDRQDQPDRPFPLPCLCHQPYAIRSGDSAIRYTPQAPPSEGVISRRERGILRGQRQHKVEHNLSVSDELDVLKAVTAELVRAGISDGMGMNDTSSEMDQRYRALLMQRTGEERLIMGCAMRDTARAFVEASLRAQDPQATVESIRKGLFLRFYGQEFDAERRAKILAAIESSAHSVDK